MQVVRVTRHNGVMTFSGENYDGSVDDVGCTRGGAELPARAREVFVKRHNFNFCSPQKPSECDLCGTIAPSLPYNARRYPEISTMSQSPMLGIMGESLAQQEQLAEFFGVKEGVLVKSVNRNSAAEKA